MDDEFIEDFELTPDTGYIRGFWIDLGSRVEKDSGWIRIEWLLQNRLEPVANGSVEPERLYRNPADGQLWHYYPAAPHMTTASPPILERISAQRARELFGDFTG